MKSSNITVTDTRVLDAIRDATAKSVGVASSQLVKNVSDNLQLMKCKILRVYNSQQEVYVELLSNKKKVKAKILNPFMSKDVNISFAVDGVTHNDKTGYYITPFDDLLGVVLEFKDKGFDVEYCFLGFIDNGVISLNSNSVKAELLFKVDENYISITEERTNIKSENLFINGLPYTEPELKNYYNKTEIDKLLKAINPDLNINQVLNNR